MDFQLTTPGPVYLSPPTFVDMVFQIGTRWAYRQLDQVDGPRNLFRQK
jgi:hypothetical protein